MTKSEEKSALRLRLAWATPERAWEHFRACEAARREEEARQRADARPDS